MSHSIYVLKNTVMKDAWGSKTAIPNLLGEPNESGEPQSELWLGAHPNAPSEAICGDRRIPLTELIAGAPEAALGPGASRRFSGQLPFLFKYLTASKALSIQAHPNRAQAIEGFEKEDALGIPRTARNRSYRDGNHKPELICAVTPFWGLNGFRPVESIIEHFQQIECREFDAEFDAFRNAPGGDGLQRFFAAVLRAGKERQSRAVEQAVASCAGKQDDFSVWMRKIAEKHPGDSGILCVAFLNLVCLQPGEAMFLPAGQLHAYLDGCGMEIMANSDNVLRGGLTESHIDVEELLRVLVYDTGVPTILKPAPLPNGEAVYDTPAEEFRLSVIDLKPGRPYPSPVSHGAEILLCASGEGTVVETGAEEAVAFKKGTSLFVSASASYTMLGDARVYKAAAPEWRQRVRNVCQRES